MVVLNDGWGKNLAVPLMETLVCLAQSDKMTSRGVLTCRFNSHPFQERNLILDQPVKIGRSVARAKPAPNNAIFDCKVLSRNHALLWYETGKFYLQDTKSSNGTFVNNHRLSKGAEESAPREVCSGDIVQFGVDVMENAGKVTHGCIIATLRLFLPDGKEAKASSSTVNAQESVPPEDLYALNSFLQDALLREMRLEKKLKTLQSLMEELKKNSDLGWKALIDEDRLLSRVETLECQLQAYAKNTAEDSLRDELKKLQEDKLKYQGTAKLSLQKILEEKMEAAHKLQDLENSMANVETQCSSLKQLLARSQQDLRELAQKYSQQSLKLNNSEEQHKEALRAFEEEKEQLQAQLEEHLKVERALQAKLEKLQTDGDLTQLQLEAVQSHLSGLDSGVTMDLTIQRISDTLKVDSKERPDNSDLISEADQISKKELDNSDNNSVSINQLKDTIAKMKLQLQSQNEMLASLREKKRECEKQNEQLYAELNKMNQEHQALIDRLKDNSLAQINPHEPEEEVVLKKLQWEAQQNEKQPQNSVENVSQMDAQLMKLQPDEKIQHSDSGVSGQVLETSHQQVSNSEQPVLVENTEQMKRLYYRVEELEEEVVVLRERCSQSNMERAKLTQELRHVQSVSGQSSISRLVLPAITVFFGILLFFWLQL